MTLRRYIPYLILVWSAFLIAGCADEASYLDPSKKENGYGDVTLSLKVSIANTKGYGGTRAEPFVPADNPYELINTLRVIIMREDNTVEFNRMIHMPAGVGLDKVGQLKFDVSTDQGEPVAGADGHLTRTENKRIYLVANEASIPNEEVRNLLVNLKEGYYKQEETVTPPESDDESGQPGRVEKFSVYIAGDPFLPSAAENIMIYNVWTKPDETVKDNYAVPMVDNSGTSKEFVPMSEFYDISVTSDITNPGNDRTVEQELFITRNLVKFQFEIDAAPGTESFKVTDITFSSLMQKEYLFPKGTVYYPDKYNENGSVNIEDKEIIKYSTPSLINDDNQIRSYIFKPLNFRFNSQSPAGTPTEDLSKYNPELYFCESKTQETIGGDGPDKDITLFKVAIGVEFDMDEPVLNDEGKPVLDGEGNQLYQSPRREFEAKTLSLPQMLPRNTIVKVKMTLSDGELDCVVTVFPYTAVNLNPEFGFSAPESDKLTVEPTMELTLGGKDGLLYPTFTSTDGNTIQNIYWVSSNPSIVLLGNEVTDVTDQRYVEPSSSVELPYEQLVQDKSEAVPVRIIPKGVGSTYVTAYTQSGLVARCRVTVKE